MKGNSKGPRNAHRLMMAPKAPHPPLRAPHDTLKRTQDIIYCAPKRLNRTAFEDGVGLPTPSSSLSRPGDLGSVGELSEREQGQDGAHDTDRSSSLANQSVQSLKVPRAVASVQNQCLFRESIRLGIGSSNATLRRIQSIDHIHISMGWCVRRTTYVLRTLELVETSTQSSILGPTRQYLLSSADVRAHYSTK